MPLATRPPRVVPPALTGLGLALLALIPRVVATGSFVTPDEGGDWFIWSGKFLAALRAGRFGETGFVGHPGVTTLWLGALGHLLAEAFSWAGWLAPDDYVGWMHLLRLPLGVVAAACVGLAYPLLRKLFGQPIALVTGILWATSPLMVALSQVLHVDALQTSWMLLALLSALLAFRIDDTGERLRPGMLLASGACGGLALLTKSPAIVLLPMVGLIALVGARRRRVGLIRAVGAAAAPVAGWALIAALTWLALWPLAWVNPGQAVWRVAAEVLNNGAQPHEAGNFFLGRAVADPGPLFYPVALAFRLTPWTLLGAVLGGVALARGWPAQRVALRLLLICGLMYLLAITLLAKKFDRYALPVVPLIELLAAVGWVWAAEQLATRNARLAARATALVTGGLLALSLINLAWYHPYELSYYSPLLGGGPAAAQTIPVGWGEGYDQAMAFIVSQPDGCQRAVAVWMPTMIERYRARCWNLRSLHALRSPDNDIGYVMLYRDVIQRGLYADVVDQLASQQEPLYTVRIHGIELAYVYQLPYPIANRIDVDIGPAIRLQGYTIDAARLRTTGAITLRLQWQARAPVGQDLMLAVRLLDQAGATVAQIDVPPAGPEAPSSGWQLYKYLSRTQPLPVAGNLPAGSYWLALALYTPGDFARLTPHNPPPAPGAPAYDQTALLLGPISVP